MLMLTLLLPLPDAARRSLAFAVAMLMPPMPLSGDALFSPLMLSCRAPLLPLIFADMPRH